MLTNEGLTLERKEEFMDKTNSVITRIAIIGILVWCAVITNELSLRRVKVIRESHIYIYQDPQLNYQPSIRPPERTGKI